ncbi:MAG: FG-GAP-like repeat-containing protein [Crocinitomicaceae bacterium]
MQYLSLFLFLSAGTGIFAQYNFEYNPSVPVSVNSTQLVNPWAGGLNYAQIADFDFDFDGDLDLYIFDRSSNNIRVFLQEGTGINRHYEFLHNADQYFPADIRYRSTLVDFDNDGRKDLFAYGIGGLAVYRNVGNAIDGLQWELFDDLLYSQYPNGYSNIYVSSSDIPAIVDVDFDGDMDVLTFHISGQHVEYHQNQSMELYGIPDSLKFILKNECWGKFSEDMNNSSVVLNDPNSPCVGGNIANPLRPIYEVAAKHAGSSLLALDYDNSGVLDLILGDVSYNNLTLLINGGTSPNSDSPMISQDNNFPSNTIPVEMQLFPASFYVDVDFDGVKDLIVCPNAKNVSENKTSILFYKNLGSNNNPTFVYSEKNFLQKDMIEHGMGSIPVFVDLNEDGLSDLIVGNFYQYKEPQDKQSVLAYYRNTGTLNSPAFALIDDNYLDLSLENYGLRSVPTFGDIDNDGDQDLFIGREDGTLVHYQNFSAGSGAIFNNGIINYKDNLNQTISVTTYCFPQLFDLNNDGLLDLILGKKTGELVYYKNIGTPSNPSFQLTNSNLGNIDVSTANPDGYPAPHFFRQNGETRLFLGDLTGRCNFYTGIDGNIDPTESFTLISENYANINTQAYSSFWVNDLNNDGNLEFYVGQDLGGIYRFEHDPNSSSSLDETTLGKQVIIYPNPASNSFTISSEKEMIQSIHLSNIEGKFIHSEEINTLKTVVNSNEYPTGIYFVKVLLKSGNTVIKKIVKN